MTAHIRSRIFAAALALGVVAPHHALAQSFPSRPIKLLSTFSAGSPQDLLLRAVGELVSADVKQPVIVDNRPGAVGANVLGHMVTQKPDGYVLGVVVSAALALSPQMQKLPYDPATDFTYVMQMASFPLGIAVKADSPFKSWADLVAHAKANPGKMTYGTPGQGSVANIGAQRLQVLAGISMTHVPHKGAMEIIPAVLGDHVSAMVTGTEWKPHVESGAMRLLMVWTDKRLPGFASVPTARDIGYPFDLDVSFGLLAPKGLDPVVASQLHGAFKKAIETATVVELIEKYNMIPAYLDGPAFKARMASIAAEMKPVIEKLGLARKD